MKKHSVLIIILLVILLGVAAAYWYFILRVPSGTVTLVPGNQTVPAGFQPLNSNTQPQTGGQNNPQANTAANNAGSGSATASSNASMPALRQLSATPVGGFGLNTTAPMRAEQTGTTTFRWVDRGRGNIYEAYGDKPDIMTLSNTLVPKIYQSWWNKPLTAFLAQYMGDKSDSVTTVIANIVKTAVSSSSGSAASTATSSQQVSETPFQLKGSLISGNIIAVAESPAKDRLLIVAKSNDRAVGYISKFDGTGQTQLFNIPLTQITADWPETSTIAITTKASASYAGYLYFINAKTGVLKEILGGIAGLSAKVNKDASMVLYSSTGKTDAAIDMAIFDVKTGKTSDVIFKTLAEKCVWSSRFAEDAYCAVPYQIPNATYPDDWYLGRASFTDDIWQLDAKTGNAHKVADLLNLGKAIIDGYNMQIDGTDNYLLFMNKNDLSLWSLDLISSTSN